MRLPSNIQDVKDTTNFNEKINEARRMTLARELVGENASFDLVKEVADKLPEFVPKDASIAINRQEASEMGFKGIYESVRTNGKWDYKQQEIGGIYENFGNQNFAAVMDAKGIPNIVAKIGAGIYQVLSGTSPLKQNLAIEAYKYRGGTITYNGVSLTDIVRDPNFGDDSKDQDQMKKMWDILEKIKDQNLDKVSDSKTRIDFPRNDSEDKPDTTGRK